MTFKQRVALATRLTASYAAGLLVGGLLTGRGNIAVVVMGVLLSWPLYVVALIVTIVFAKSVLTHPAVWSTIAIVVVATICLLALPFDGHILSVATTGIFCAIITGVTFYWWNVRYPIDRISN